MNNKCCVCGGKVGLLDTPFYIRGGHHPLCTDCCKRVSVFNNLSVVMTSKTADPNAFANAYISTYESVVQSGFPGNTVSELQQDLDYVVDDYYKKHPGFKEMVENCPVFTGDRNVVLPFSHGTDNSWMVIHKNPGLRWYKFIIYIQVILIVMSIAHDALFLYTGYIYGDMRDLVYARFPNIVVLNWIYATCSLGYSVFTIYVRNELACFKRNAPSKFLSLSIAVLIISWIYVILTCLIYGINGVSQIIAEQIGRTIGIIIMFIINYNYFAHRAYLFVN